MLWGAELQRCPNEWQSFCHRLIEFVFPQYTPLLVQGYYRAPVINIFGVNDAED